MKTTSHFLQTVFLIFAVTLSYGSAGDAKLKTSPSASPSAKEATPKDTPAPAPKPDSSNLPTTPQPAIPIPPVLDGTGYPPPPANQVSVIVVASVSTGGARESGATTGMSPAIMGPVSPLIAALSAPVNTTGTYTGVRTTPAFESSYARSLARFRKLIVEVEFPVDFGPAKDVKSSPSLAAKNYSSVFFTPSVRLVFANAVRGDLAQEKPRSPYLAAYPFISIGGGFAHFSPNSFTSSGALSGASSTTKGAFQIGGGVDFLPFKKTIGFRIEARDFYSGGPNLGIPGLTYHNNVVAGGGLVFWFGH